MTVPHYLQDHRVRMLHYVEGIQFSSQEGSTVAQYHHDGQYRPGYGDPTSKSSLSPTRASEAIY